MKRIYKNLKRSIVFILALTLAIMPVLTTSSKASAASKNQILPFVILTSYNRTLSVGDEFLLAAVTSTGDFPTFKSSNSKVVSVNTYGRVIAKAPGKAEITAKINKAEATCKILVKKTEIKLSEEKLSLEVGEERKITAETSTGSIPVFKSAKSSIVTVDDEGKVKAIKPGETKITVKADGTTRNIPVKVKTPKITIATRKISMYRNKIYKLKVTVSSGRTPTFKTDKRSVATISEKGVITAVKHGTANITVSLDGVKKICTVTVKSPKIKIKPSSVTLKTGKSKLLSVSVSSGNKPEFKSNKTKVATVDENGKVTAIKKGTALITVSEDGTKESVVVTVK
ncbi:MAG: Ig-like domain-containing protein [Lachnospiraceae bacterium]|nr:Ig-like domain-containing protein [Lachnospiraceae bacterium]